ncbi:MAG: RNA polymerase sigma factor [Limisphaerales bacterium]
MGADKTEQKMIEQCRRGNPEAWDQLFDRHYSAVGRYVFQLAPDFQRSDVEEICQETFVSVIRNLEKFNGACQLQTWIFKIAGNKSRDYREKLKAAKRGGGMKPLSIDEPDPETGRKIDPAAGARSPDQAMMTMENAALVGHGLEELQENCREVIDLRYFGDCSYKEISKILNLNEKTVSSRLSKCLDKLEEIMKMKFSGENFPVSPSNYH